MTCGPSNLIHAIYGHTAIRVNDPLRKWDVVFNYGVFSFNAPNFVLRFAEGKTDYMLAPERYENFYSGYVRNGRSIKEQVLNLTAAEKQQLLNFLINNAKPENREYRYNYIKDNCATRVRDVVEQQVDGKLVFPEDGKGMTYREHVSYYQRMLPFENFGIQLVLGVDLDETVSAYEEMFLPDYLFRHFADAVIKTNGETRPLVKATNVIYEAPETTDSWFIIHLVDIILLLLFVWVGIITFRQLKSGRTRYAVDYVLLFITGLVGVIMLWFYFYSELPATSPNLNLLWAVPFNLPFLFLWLVKSWRPVLKWFWVALSAWLILFIPISIFLPQQFVAGFYLVIGMVLCRSILHSRFLLQNTLA